MRIFNTKQRQAVELVTGRTGDADHIIPHSAGGDTTVENCQLISGDTNRAKGAFVFQLRRWQSEFLKAWDSRTGRAFLLVVIPAGGKTFASLEAVRLWMAAGRDRRVIVVVPTDNLREQWRDEARKFGMELQTKEFGTSFKDDFQGGVVTYSLVANQPLVFRKLCAVAPTMVVFDEFHHCGDEASYGRGITDAFELAKERLLMSGTAWRSDGTAMPWVRYDGNGFAVADYSYDYPHALTDEVVRFLVFDYSRGTITNDFTGESRTLSSETGEDEASRVLRRLLDARGDFVREQIKQAHRKLVELRATFPDAGALAACIDQSHAVMVAGVIREVTGCEPSVIVSDADLETDTVRDFRDSNKEWIVAVRKVSEGTDIKRLQVLCYLTNTTSELFFRQLVGRVSRYRNMEDREAFVYLPADPRLIQCAQNIENAQVQALKEQSDAGDVEKGDIPKDGEGLFDSFSTSHGGTDLVMIGSDAVPSDLARLIESIAVAQDIPMQKVYRVMMMLPSAAMPSPQQPARHKSKEEVMDDLRAKCNKQAWRLAKIINVEVKEVHGRFARQSEMTEGDLRKKLELLGKEIAKNVSA